MAISVATDPEVARWVGRVHESIRPTANSCTRLMGVACITRRMIMEFPKTVPRQVRAIIITHRAIIQTGVIQTISRGTKKALLRFPRMMANFPCYNSPCSISDRALISKFNITLNSPFKTKQQDSLNVLSKHAHLVWTQTVDRSYFFQKQCSSKR